jgi:uncharacterized protein (TIGR03663 family)
MYSLLLRDDWFTKFNTKKTFFYINIAILLLGTVLRFWSFTEKPAQFDEGVNGWIVDRISEDGFYKYDPTNYHGPLHFYALQASTLIFGKTIWALRIPVILMGIASIFLLTKFRRYFGATSASLAAFGMAISPGFIFYQRYSIHEAWLVFFMILFVWGLFGLAEEGDRKSILATSIGFVGMVLSKETYLIHVVVIGIAFACYKLWDRLVPSAPAFRWAKQSWTFWEIRKPLAGLLFILIFFYSGNFFNWPGVLGIVTTFGAWIKTGLDHTTGFARHEQQVGFFNYYWFWLCFRYEPWILLGFFMSIRVLWRSDWKLRMVAIYALGCMLAYSFLPYKTPWCIISIIWPYFILAGALVKEMWVPLYRPLGIIVVAVATVYSSYRAIDLNYYKYDDDKEPYAYVQTSREIAKLLGPLDAMLARVPGNFNVQGRFYISSHFPLAWMLNHYNRIDFHKREDASKAVDADFILCESDDVKIVAPLLKNKYYRVNMRIHAGMWPAVAYFSPRVFALEFPGVEPQVPGVD